MAEQPMQAPAGFQRPGIPGAGNILDPEVRGELREKIQEAVRGAPAQAAPVAQNPPAAAGAPPADAPGAAASASPSRIGPFPHGDVDLRSLAANVFKGVRPQRGRAGRRFYFLADDAPAAQTSEPPPAPAPNDAKPG